MYRRSIAPALASATAAAAAVLPRAGRETAAFTAAPIPLLHVPRHPPPSTLNPQPSTCKNRIAPAVKEQSRGWGFGVEGAAAPRTRTHVAAQLSLHLWDRADNPYFLSMKRVQTI